MAIFNKNNLLFITLVYIAIVNLIYNPISVLFSVPIVFLVYFFLILKSVNFAVIFPIILYPFMFLLRAQDPSSIVLTILPELFTALAIAIHLIHNGFRLIKNWHLLIVTIYAIVILFIAMAHVEEIRLLPVVVRQYILPLGFLITFVDAALRDVNLPDVALKFSILSFSFVALSSILNLLHFLTVTDAFPPLYPYLNYGESITSGYLRLSEGIFGQRLNLFTGGALGSSAAIFFTLGMVPLIAPKNKFGRGYAPLFFILLVASVLTRSVSVVIPIAVMLFILVVKKSKLFLVSGISLSVYVLLSTSFFVGISPADYFLQTSGKGIIDYLGKIDLLAFLMGSGPSLNSAGFVYAPKVYIIDIGIFRVFTELGIFTFTLFLIFLVRVFWHGLRNALTLTNCNGREYTYLFMVFIFLIHGNITALPPFFPLFSIGVAGIFVASLSVIPSLKSVN